MGLRVLSEPELRFQGIQHPKVSQSGGRPVMLVDYGRDSDSKERVHHSWLRHDASDDAPACESRPQIHLVPNQAQSTRLLFFLVHQSFGKRSAIRHPNRRQLLSEQHEWTWRGGRDQLPSGQLLPRRSQLPIIRPQRLFPLLLQRGAIFASNHRLVSLIQMHEWEVADQIGARHLEWPVSTVEAASVRVEPQSQESQSQSVKCT